MREVHAPALRRPATKAAVLAAFLGLFLLSCACLPRLERGLDHAVALPRDSYLQQAGVAACCRSWLLSTGVATTAVPAQRPSPAPPPQHHTGIAPDVAPSSPLQYYEDVFASLRVGLPLMLVVRGLNVSEASPDVNRTCSGVCVGGEAGLRGAGCRHVRCLPLPRAMLLVASTS